MLIQFSVANFRSIKTRQTLSMAAGSSKTVRHKFSLPTGNRAVPRVVKTAGIFGPNGSGKTSFISAMGLFRGLIQTSAKDSQANWRINITPFLMDASTRDQPSEFEIVFVFEGTLYQYGFTATLERFQSEWLFVTPPGGRLQKWIDRTYSPSKEKYETYINPSIPGEKRVWAESTRPNSLVLSTAVHLNSDALRPAYDWIDHYLRVVDPGNDSFGFTYTAKLCQGERKNDVIRILRRSGLDVDDIEVEESEYVAPIPKGVPEPVREYFTSNMKGIKDYDVFFIYKDCEGESVSLPLEEESDGTHMLFSLAGPLLDVSDNGLVIVVDELHRSLHPIAFRHLIEEFFSSENEDRKGQLIFTSHETHIMQPDVMHRDEVWLTDRTLCAGTHLTPLTDFKARPGEAFRTSYLAGRYGGIPVSHADE